MSPPITPFDPPTPSHEERIAHVVRRLGLGVHSEAVAAARSVDDAIATALDLSAPRPPLPTMKVPVDLDELTDMSTFDIPLRYWLGRMTTSDRLVEERLVWFWSDHFATGVRKVRSPYLLWQQHALIRRHATGRFDDLLRGIARDPPMLVYLDGRTNSVGAINENFAREVMGLHTMGPGPFTQGDVAAAARAFSGWVVAGGERGRSDRRLSDVPPWTSAFIPQRHDGGEKDLFGLVGRFGMDDAIEVILERPETARRIASKMFADIVGAAPQRATADRLGEVFRRDWDIMKVVEEIAADPAFTADRAVRSKVRTPIERLLEIFQGFPTNDRAGRIAFRALHDLGFIPFGPPNPAGFPSGEHLLDPHRLIHAFDLAGVVADPAPQLHTDDVLWRLGIHDVSAVTHRVVEGARTPFLRIALAANSPEYALI